jgi:hypothetical protein
MGIYFFLHLSVDLGESGFLRLLIVRATEVNKLACIPLVWRMVSLVLFCVRLSRDEVSGCIPNRWLNLRLCVLIMLESDVENWVVVVLMRLRMLF